MKRHAPRTDRHPPGYGSHVPHSISPASPDDRPVPSFMSRSQPLWTDELLDAPHDAPDKARRVRRMFNAIAPRYALINSVFSVGRDAAWRRFAVRLAAVRRDDDALDIACGTGDLTRLFAFAQPRRVLGCDFAHEMLLRAESAKKRIVRSGQANHCTLGPVWIETDALRLPFRDGSFSIVSCAFGVRNFHDLDAGLAEMRRVLRRGGRAVILEFTRPGNRLVRALYEFYSNRLMPLGATLLSGDTSGAYRYLPRSVVSFLDAEQMITRLRGAGFHQCTATPLSFGVVTVYLAMRDA